MEGWKKWYIVIAIVFIVTAIACKIIRTQAPDTGLAEVDQLEDLLSLQVELEYALGDNGSKGVVVKDLTQNQENYIRHAEEADIGSFWGAGGVSLPGPLSVTGCSGVFVVLS